MSSDSNLVLRLLREFRSDFDGFRDEMRDELRGIKDRLGRLELAVGEMATNLLALSGIVKDHERRIRKLESRPSK